MREVKILLPEYASDPKFHIGQVVEWAGYIARVVGLCYYDVLTSIDLGTCPHWRYSIECEPFQRHNCEDLLEHVAEKELAPARRQLMYQVTSSPLTPVTRES